ncbi:hypothetical protein KGY79_01560 [Candidatus Bipolaricaulota bacterium]|nr:hypothetical protein [Candidatus Bipolaricaulota bacterium]
MPTRPKYLVFIVSLFLFFTWTSPAIGSSIDKLENLSDSDFIPEVRRAASRALARKYIDQKIPATELTQKAENAGTVQLREAVIEALTRRYKDAKRVGSLEEALKKANELEEKVKVGEIPAVREAASSALGLYYLAFNLHDVEGYSMGELENKAIEAKDSGLKKAAATSLEFVYPNHYTAKGLIDLINSTSHKWIKRGSAGGLAIRYYSEMSPNPKLETLREMASDENESRFIREAAGRAFGKLALDQVNSEQLEELALSGNTEEIREGAAEAWSRKLTRSEKTQEELLRMASAATGFAPPAYRSAITTALADRMYKTGPSIQGG